MPSRNPCPCGGGVAYTACCGVYHRGEREPPDAVTLMRSRYSAFARGEVSYLVSTLHADHPDHPTQARSNAEVVASIRRACERVRYLGLTVLDHARADTEGIARVLFHARLFQQGRDVSVIEASEFGHDGTGWRYRSGTAYAPRDVTGDVRTLTLDTLAARVKAGAP